MPQQNYTSSAADQLSDSVSQIGERISDTASQAKASITKFGQNAAGKIDQNRGAAADRLDNAAWALHRKAENLPGGEKVTNLAHTAADKLRTTASYVRRHNVNSMMTGVGQLVKRNPGRSLLAAAALGFLVARAFRKD